MSTPSSLGARVALVALLVAGAEPLQPSEGTATALGGSVGASLLSPVPGNLLGGSARVSTDHAFVCHTGPWDV